MLRVPVLCSRLVVQHQNVVAPQLYRHFSMDTPVKMPGFVTAIFDYASQTYMTQGIQTGMEAIHSCDVPWAATFVLSGLALRLLTAPIHIAADRMFAKRLHLTVYLTEKMSMKVAERHKIPITLDPKTREPKFCHSNKKLNLKAHGVDQGLQRLRIMVTKASTIPVWVFSSVAIRNILTSDFGIGLKNSFLWIDNIVVADPYFVLPIAVGVFGFINFHAQKMVFPSEMFKPNRTYTVILATSLSIGVVLLTQMPACISLYWLSVSMTGILQTLLLRHPRVKQFCKIRPLPWDSKTPFKDLFLVRKR